MKTRNELERITFKINQLKNKYSCENMEELPSDIFNRQTPISSSQVNQKKQTGEEYIKSPHSDSFEDIYRKEFRTFRNQLYEHIDHQLARMKNRSNNLEEQIQELMNGEKSETQYD